MQQVRSGHMVRVLCRDVHRLLGFNSAPAIEKDRHHAAAADTSRSLAALDSGRQARATPWGTRNRVRSLGARKRRKGERPFDPCQFPSRANCDRVARSGTMYYMLTRKQVLGWRRWIATGVMLGVIFAQIVTAVHACPNLAAAPRPVVEA